jgi:predicted secreted protein
MPTTLAPVDGVSKAFSGKGTVLGIGPIVGSTGTATFVPIAELKTFNFSGTKNDIEDVTNSDSAGRAREYLVTLLDSGDISVSGNYIAGDAGQTAFRAAFNLGSVNEWEIQLPKTPLQTTTGDLITFNGVVTENSLDIQFDKAVTFSGKIKVSGVITFVSGS